MFPVRCSGVTQIWLAVDSLRSLRSQCPESKSGVSDPDGDIPNR